MGASVSRRRLLKEGAWVSIGQIGSALGTLVGVRALTEFAPPDIFGSVALCIGVTALALGTLVSPTMQAALRFYPDYSAGRVPELRANIVTILSKRTVIFSVAVTLASPLFSRFLDIGLSVVFLCLLLLLLDGLRSLESVFLNAARKQKAFAMISLGEAWGRPLMAVFALHVLGINVESILAAYAATSAITLIVFYSVAKPEGVTRFYKKMQEIEDASLKKAINKFSRPLAPMSALGWVNGLGDRYLIGSLMSVQQVGVYAAVYGLVSRPFLITSGMVELTLRPVYNEFVAKHMHREAEKLLLKWLLIVGAIVCAGFIVIATFDELIIRILLAEEYRSGMTLMIWIAGGYSLLALSDVFTKVLYAYGCTGQIFMVQLLGAVLSLTFATIGIKLFGLIGAAMAVPAYFAVVLIYTIFVSHKCKRVPISIQKNL